MTWINYFVTSLHGEGTEGHLPADTLAAVLKAHKGGEAYHCAFDLVDEELKLEELTDEIDDKGKRKRRYHAQTKETLARFPKTVTKYTGVMRPAFGFVWFDFDSGEDGGVAALTDARAFAAWVNSDAAVYFYSGSKGFHVGIPLSAFGLEASATLGKSLNAFATALKKTRYKTIDTTVFNAGRKFRALGTKHPKTGLFKIRLADLSLELPAIKKLAARRGSVAMPHAPPTGALPHLKAELAPVEAAKSESISLDEWRRYRQPEGTRAFEECNFLKYCKENPAKINEPQWYAAASIVGRFVDGRIKFQTLSAGHPGYSSTATDEKLEQALQASGPRTCKAISEVFGGCGECIHFQKIKSPVVILEKSVIPTEATGFYDLICEDGDRDKVKRVPNYDDILSAFHRDMPYKTIADMRTVFVFEQTHYVEFTPIEIKGFAEDNFDPKPKDRMRGEFYSKVLANHIARKSFFTTGIENKINFKNGILELDSMVLAPHSPDYGFRWVLPYDFDPTAACPVFDAWISDVMLGDAELIAILQEFMGYIVRGGEYKYHKALWLSGSGRNGKSTFLSVLKALIGDGNYSALSIKQIITDKFASADLDGKIANFSEETSPEELSDSGPFKNLTGDGDVNAQKKYGDPYKFRNRAKLIMTYNEVPMLKDLSPGMLSRPVIIPWKKDLSGPGTQDKTLKHKLFAELPGIFNFALAGWNRLEVQGDFSTSAKSQIEMEEIRKSSCSAAQWAADTLQFMDKESSECLKPRQLYEAYKQTVGQYAYSEQRFYKRLNSIPEVAKRKRRTADGVEYFGMKFRRGSVPVTDF